MENKCNFHFIFLAIYAPLFFWHAMEKKPVRKFNNVFLVAHIRVEPWTLE
jgi:hypothetical protein